MDKNDIQKAVELAQSIPKIPIKVRINEDWLNQQIKRGLIRKEDNAPNGNTIFMGVNVEITDEVEHYEFIYEGNADDA